jgi:ABC-type sugar transport system permease subunit
MVLIFSFFIAVILNQEFRGRIIMRAIFFLPLITTGGVVMRIISGDGLAQSMMSGTGGSSLFQVTSIQDMLLDSGIPHEITTFIFGFINDIFGLIWKSGIQILLLLAGLQTISPSMYEAASIDGATGWETFWKITLPSLYPVLTLALVYTVIDSFVDTTNPIMNSIISSAQSLNFGVSSALCWVYFAVIAVVVGLIFIILKKISKNN